jgi:hypothetical protein
MNGTVKLQKTYIQELRSRRVDQPLAHPDSADRQFGGTARINAGYLYIP